MVRKLDRGDKTPEYISIGEAAERTGLTQRTLRYWEELGLFKPPARVAGGQRLYSAEDLQRIEQILRMKKLLGFSLSEIKAAVETEEAKQHLREDIKHERSLKRQLKQTCEAAAITSQQIAMVEEKIAQLQTMRRRLVGDLNDLNEKVARINQKLGEPQAGTRTEKGVQATV